MTILSTSSQSAKHAVSPLLRSMLSGAAVVLIASMQLGLAGCNAKPAVPDATLATNVQNQIAADTAVAGQQISVQVQGGVATLNGVVANDAQRALAARDAAGVEGVKQVQNALVVGVASAAVTTAPPAPVPTRSAPGLPPAETRRELERDHHRDEHTPAPVERQYPQQPSSTYAPPSPPVQQQPAQPPQPVFRTVTVPAGDTLPVRVTQTLDSATTQQGDSFSGVVASDIVIDGVVAIPSGSSVSGQVDQVHEAAHFKGAALLTVSLNSVSRRGDRISVTTDPYTVEGKGRGKNTAEKAGVGAVGGAILGGIFGGGKGAAIGAAAGGGAGAGVNAITRGQQVQIPSETIVRFRLTTPLTVKARVDHDEHGADRRPLQ